MPIRFRCVYCDKLLGIARRKAGAVVDCPQCHQPLIVPTPEPEPEATAAVGSGARSSRLFERDDFEALLDGSPDQTYRPPEDSDPPRRTRTKEGPPPVPPISKTAGIRVSGAVLILLGLVALVLIGGAFAGGVLVGKGLQ